MGLHTGMVPEDVTDESAWEKLVLHNPHEVGLYV